jgi:hypothetical protein
VYGHCPDGRAKSSGSKEEIRRHALREKLLLVNVVRPLRLHDMNAEASLVKRNNERIFDIFMVYNGGRVSGR